MQIANSVHVLQYSRPPESGPPPHLERGSERISLERVAGLQRAAGAERACLFARSESIIKDTRPKDKHDTGLEKSPK